MKTKQNTNLTVLSTAIMGFVIGVSIGIIMYLLEGRLGLIYPYSSTSSSHGVFIIPMGILSAILFMIALSGSELIQFIRINKKPILTIGIIALIGTASAFLETRTLPNTLPLPDGRVINSLLEPEYNFSNLSDSLSDSELNTLYYKVIVPDDVGEQWNLSVEFAESKPYRLLKPVGNPVSRVVIVSTAQAEYAWVCCNITKGDYLFTADATTDSSLRGTLINMYDLNYKTRLFNYTDMSWENRNIGASKNPKVYNRRAALHQDGKPYAHAMETRNVSISGVPELMKVFLI